MLASDRKPRDQEIDVFGVTDIGKVRSENQDQFLICGLHKQIEVHGTSLPDVARLRSFTGDRLGFLALVADGLGGHASGQEASRTAVKSVLEYVAHSMQCFYTQDPHHEEDFLESLHRSVMQAHDIVRSRTGAGLGERSMATTLTMFMGVWPAAYVVQVGDSRCYLLRDGKLERITRDQTLVQDLIDQGVVSRSEAERSTWRHVLSSAIGGSTAAPVTTRVDIRWDDVMLLCTDGITEHVDDDEIRTHLLNLKTSEQACRDLVALALTRGGRDNVTVIVGRLRSASNDGSP